MTKRSVKHAEVVVVGSSNTDMVIELDRLPAAGETLLGRDLKTVAGGKGANQAVAAARAGAKVALVARVGYDLLGNKAIEGFAQDDIDTSFVVRDFAAPSGAALIFLDRQGRNSIAVALGANNRLSVANVRAARGLIAEAKVVLMQLETPMPAVECAARLAARCGAITILNPAPARRLSRSLLRDISILTPNENEAELLTGIKQTGGLSAATRAAETLRALGAKTVVITLGKRGALIVDQDGARRIHGYKVKVRDTTAAGDVFNGAFAVSLAKGESIDDSVRFANAAAALSVTEFGAQRSAPRRGRINRFLESKSDA